MHKRHIFTIILLLIMPPLVLINFHLSPSPAFSEKWEGYLPVLIAEGGELSTGEFDAFFGEQGWTDIISETSQEVEIFTYRGEKKIDYSQLDRLMEPSDPRYDRYLKTLKGYFRGDLNGKPAQVFYLGHMQDERSVLNRTVQQLEERGVDYFIPHRETGKDKIYQLLFLLNLIVLSIMLPRRGRILFIVGGAAMFSGALTIQLPLFIMMTAQLVGWAVCIEWAGTAFTRHFNIGYSLMRQDIKKRIALYVLFAAAGSMVGISSGMYTENGRMVLLCLNISAIHAGLLYLYYNITRRRVLRQQHTLFFPIPMGLRKGGTPVIVPKWAVIICTAVVIPVVFYWSVADRSVQDVTYPQPVQAGTVADLEWDSINSFLKQKETVPSDKEEIQMENSLPDISDYIIHRAYQDSFIYGREYRFPYPGETVSLKVYEKKNSGILEQDRIFMIFTDDWYTDIITDASTNGVSRLLYAQKRPVSTAHRKIDTFRIPTHTFLGYVAIFLLGGPIVFSIVTVRKNKKGFAFEKNQHRKGQKVA